MVIVCHVHACPPFLCMYVKERERLVYMCSCGIPVTLDNCCPVSVDCGCGVLDAINTTFLSLVNDLLAKNLNRSGTVAFRGLETDCISV